MFRFNDIFLVIVACYVIYKIGFVDGFTLVNLFIAVCTVVAFVSTILRRSGYMERLKEKENEETGREERNRWGKERVTGGRNKAEKYIYANGVCEAPFLFAKVGKVFVSLFLASGACRFLFIG